MAVYLFDGHDGKANSLLKSAGKVKKSQKSLPDLIYDYLVNEETSMATQRAKDFKADIHMGLPNADLDPTGDLAVVCDDGRGLSKQAQTIIAKVPFMADFHLNAGAGMNAIDFKSYAGAKIISMDSDVLNMTKFTPDVLMQTGWFDNLIVNHKLHSIWFSRGGKNIDFKYDDGEENEATYESKREIVAGFVAEYLNAGYRMNDDVINKVFREYWAEHSGVAEKEVSFKEASELLMLKPPVWKIVTRYRKSDESTY